MRRTGILLLLILLTSSCEKEIAMAKFRIELNGFDLQSSPGGEADDLPSFTHRLANGVVIFSNPDASYLFKTDIISEEGEGYFELPEGEYEMEFRIPEASMFGQEEGSFSVKPQTVLLTKETELLSVDVEPNCTLFLVYDENDQLNTGAYIIERHSYAYGAFTSYPLSSDTVAGLYYAYFTPDPEPEDPSVFLWFFNGQTGGKTGGIPTADLQLGYQYHILIIE